MSEEMNIQETQSTQTGPQGSAPAAEAANYDDLIKTDKNLQSWLDSRVNTATSTAVQKALEKERLLADEKVSEAEKLARMNKEEKQGYELEKLKKQVAAYESEKAASALKEEALKLAVEKGVPSELVELIPFASIKAEEVTQRVEGFKAVFDKAVSDRVGQALSGAGAPKGQGAANAPDLSKMTYSEIAEYLEKHPGATLGG